MIEIRPEPGISVDAQKLRDDVARASEGSFRQWTSGVILGASGNKEDAQILKLLALENNLKALWLAGDHEAGEFQHYPYYALFRGLQGAYQRSIMVSLGFEAETSSFSLVQSLCESFARHFVALRFHGIVADDYWREQFSQEWNDEVRLEDHLPTTEEVMADLLEQRLDQMFKGTNDLLVEVVCDSSFWRLLP